MNHSPKPSLTGISGELEGHVIGLFQRVALGRHPQNDVRFDDPTVSAFHAVVSRVGNGYEIIDLGSKNKAKVNGKRVHRPVLLSDGDIVQVGNNKFRFDSVQADKMQRVEGGSWSEATEIIAPSTISDEPMHTQKIPRHRAVYFQSDRAKRDSYDVTEVLQSAPRTDRKANEANPKTKKTGRVFVNIASGIIVVFMVVLFASKYVDKSPPKPPVDRAMVRPQSPWDYGFQRAQIQEIWREWDSRDAHVDDKAEGFELLLVHALMEADQLANGAPAEWWRAYKTCVRLLHQAEGVPEHPEFREQCEQLLLRLKIEIEDEEKRLLRLLRVAKGNGQKSTALGRLRYIRELVDLDNDNSNSALARTCRHLQHEINGLGQPKSR